MISLKRWLQKRNAAILSTKKVTAFRSLYVSLKRASEGVISVEGEDDPFEFFDEEAETSFPGKRQFRIVPIDAVFRESGS